MKCWVFFPVLFVYSSVQCLLDTISTPPGWSRTIWKRTLEKCSSIHNKETTYTYCHILRRSALCSRAGSTLSVLHFAVIPRVSKTDTNNLKCAYFHQRSIIFFCSSPQLSSSTSVWLWDKHWCILLIFFLCHHLQVLQSYRRELLIKVKAQRALCIQQSVVEKVLFQGLIHQEPCLSQHAFPSSISLLSCAVLGENKAVHMSHGHHIKNRAPGVAQRTRDQCSEVMSQEIQVILRRGSVSLERHRKLQETHQKTTLPSVAESKQWGLPQLLRHMLPYNTVHFSGTIPIWSRTITAHADWCDMPLTVSSRSLQFYG